MHSQSISSCTPFDRLVSVDLGPEKRDQYSDDDSQATGLEMSV
jgi:hypothetical protein